MFTAPVPLLTDVGEVVFVESEPIQDDRTAVLGPVSAIFDTKQVEKAASKKIRCKENRTIQAERHQEYLSAM